MRTNVFFCVIVVLLSISNAAFAKPPSKDMYERAKGLYDSKRYIEAAAALGELYQADPDPWLLQKQALCYESMEQWDAALQVYNKVIQNHPNLDEKLRIFVVQAKARIENLLERPVSVSIVASLPGASVEVDGEVGVSPLVVELKRGVHVAKVSAPGHRAAQVEFDAQTQGQLITVTLAPIQIEVVLNHGAFDGDVAVTLDGQTPPGIVAQSDRVLRFVASPGTRRVVCENKAGQRAELVLMLADSDTSIQARCVPPKQAYSWPAWVVLGSGVATLAVGTGLGVDAIVKQEDADSSSRKHCEGCTTQQIVGWTLAGVGVAAVVTSIFLFPDDQESLAWLPVPLLQPTQPYSTWVWTHRF
ncbi:MAG: tetratricopeptide repeat protein [Myxococcales bacterium]|nr:tetratricopeptide repeat protein [Myxococcales bacterium]